MERKPAVVSTDEIPRAAPKRKNDEQITDDMGGCPPKVSTRADSVHEVESAMKVGSEKRTEAVPVEIDSPPPPSANHQVPEVDLTLGSVAYSNKIFGSQIRVNTRGNPGESNPAAGPSRANQELAASIGVVARSWDTLHKGVVHLRENKSGSSPIKIPNKKEVKDFPDLPDYTSSISSSSSEEDLRLLAGRNWRTAARAVRGIAPAQSSSDSD